MTKNMTRSVVHKAKCKKESFFHFVLFFVLVEVTKAILCIQYIDLCSDNVKLL